jgi:hypothetical protein
MQKYSSFLDFFLELQNRLDNRVDRLSAQQINAPEGCG